MFKRPTLLSIVCAVLVVAVSLIYCGANGYCIVRTEALNYLCLGLASMTLMSWADGAPDSGSRAQRIFTAILAMVMAGCIVTAKNYFHHYSWPACIGNLKALCLCGVQTILYGFVLWRILSGVFRWLDTHLLPREATTFSLSRWYWLNIAVRGVFLVAFFPCLFDFDAALGLRTFLDEGSAICNHHPVFVQALHAVFYTLGTALGNPSWGFAILSLLSIFGTSAIIVYGIQLLSEMGLRGRWLQGAALFLSLFPTFPYLSLTVTKDGFFAYALLLYVLTLLELHHTRAKCLSQCRYLLLHTFALLMVCLTRHQGIAIVALETLALLGCYRKVWWRVLLNVAPGFVIVLFITRVLFPYCDIEPGGKQELYGTLFQQSAYYLTVHPDDITAEEAAAIDGVLDREAMVRNYHDYITDPVKNDYKYNPRFLETSAGPRSFRHVDYTHQQEALRAYLTAWASMGLRHPLTYLEASASIWLGFFYNNGFALLDIYTPGAVNPMATTPKYHFWRFDYLADYYYQHRKALAQMPVIGWLCSIPYYIWAAFVLLALLFYRRDWSGITLFLPLLLSLGVLLICPVVSGRYALPIVITLPFLALYLLTNNSQNRKTTLS